MDQNDRKVAGPPKDFLALSHGQEWVAFYESFDKLVQDNLSRSSELLRRAMSLPEVADREVQQIRTEMEDKLTDERGKQKALLGALAEDLNGSHRQVSTLARSVGAVMSDLERLSTRVNDALATYDGDEAVPAASPVVNAVIANGSEPKANGTGSLANGTGSLGNGTGTLVASAPIAEAEAPVAPVAAAEKPGTGELPYDPKGVDPFAGEFDISDIAAAVEEQQAMLDAAEHQLDNLEDSIDLTAMADAEVVPADGAEEAVQPEPVAAAASSEPRPRPHWLSVTRVGTGA